MALKIIFQARLKFLLPLRRVKEERHFHLLAKSLIKLSKATEGVYPDYAGEQNPRFNSEKTAGEKYWRP